MAIFRIIVGHSWIDGFLHFEAQYVDSVEGNYNTMIPISQLKDKEPRACAKYIKEYITESSRRKSPLNDWANDVLRRGANLLQETSTHESENKTNKTETTKNAVSTRHGRLPVACYNKTHCAKNSTTKKILSFSSRRKASQRKRRLPKEIKRRETSIGSNNTITATGIFDANSENDKVLRATLDGTNGVELLSRVISLQQGFVPDFWI